MKITMVFVQKATQGNMFSYKEMSLQRGVYKPSRDALCSEVRFISNGQGDVVFVQEGEIEPAVQEAWEMEGSLFIRLNEDVQIVFNKKGE